MGAVKALAHWGALSDRDLDELLSWTGVPAGNIRMRFRGEVMVSKGVAVRDMINQVRAGKMRLRRSREIPGYNAFQVSVAEVNALAALLDQSRPQDPAFTGTVSAAAFGRKVGMRDGGHFIALIQTGHVTAQAVLNPKTHLTQFRMSDEDIAAFHKKFLTTTAIEEQFGLHRNGILAILRSAGARQFMLEERSIGPIWLRTNVEGILVANYGRRTLPTSGGH
ncbi:hypothetical protein [Gemmobacter sp. 24YEA27]|uniref:hypothetical protein n=1 Tax=Gemmobacter sp. 24YEA27 TaxID=3040672 RepID=UPI0024B3AF64|nr:hypothetical protein [Gemmobacter sp. 24YEA27]